MDPLVPKTSIGEFVWPALPGPKPATLLSLMFQLEQSQWWTPERLRERQLGQLGHVLRHAKANVPFYRDRLAAIEVPEAGPVAPEMWEAIPVMSKRDVRLAGSRLFGKAVPPVHGNVIGRWTAGTTGPEMEFLWTELSQFLAQASRIRELRWHKLDVRTKLAAVRRPLRHDRVGQSPRIENWTDPYAMLYATGPLVAQSVLRPTAAVAEWLVRESPAYLLTTPSKLRALLRHFGERGLRLPALRAVISTGEALPPELRAECRAAWGVPVIDRYVAAEAEALGVQCPEHDHFHVQSEFVLVEILDDKGRACAPGEVGRVVITPLHNLAMPLIRYELGDYAEVGEACACKRGLPVLKRVAGRARGRVALASGERRFPVGLEAAMRAVEPVRDFAVVQKDLDSVEVTLVAARPPIDAEEQDLTRRLVAALGREFRVAFRVVDEIATPESGVREAFRSEVDG